MRENLDSSGKRDTSKTNQDKDTLSMPHTRELSDAKALALDILVKGGWVDAVRASTKEYKLPSSKSKLMIGEALVWYAIRNMLEEAEGGVDPLNVSPLFSQKESQAFLRQTTDPEILEALVDALIQGTDAQMEEYAQITALKVLEFEGVGDALKRNENIPKVKKALERLIKEGFRLVFSGHYIEPEMVEEYFPIIKDWKHLIDVNKFMTQYLDSLKEGDRNEDFEDCEEFDEDDSLSIFLSDSTHLEKFIELTDKATVSGIIQEIFPDSDTYSKLVAKGLLEVNTNTRRSKKSTEVPRDIGRALGDYERQYSPKYGVKDLADKIGARGKEILSQRLGEWVSKGMCEHVTCVLEYNDGKLIDPAKAKEEITKALRELIRNKNSTRLQEVLEIPVSFIDDSDVDVAPILLAKRAIERDPEAEEEVTVTAKETKKVLKEPAPQSKKGGRHFVPTGLEEFKEKFMEALELSPNQKIPFSSGYSILDLSKGVNKDLSKVSFNTENIYWEEGVGSLQGLRGFQQFDNGLSFFGLEASGDWEAPVFFIIYWDGKSFRGYIPKDGNMWNTDTNTAYGNDERTDRINLEKRFPDRAKELHPEEISVETIESWHDAKKIEEDIKSRIVAR